MFWVVGGKWGFENSLPTNEEGERILNPKRTDSAIVGIGLNLFAIFYLTKIGWVPFSLPDWVSVSVGWFIASIFLLRAMGDLKYVGFFKKVRTTNFAKLDSLYFSPLCLALGVNGVIIEYLTYNAI